MDYVITNPDMNKILDSLNINPNNSNLFQHAFWPESSHDPDACKPYFENGLRLKMGFDSYLATMSPYPKNKSFASEIERDSFRGNHKIIVCIPHELEDMFFGSEIGARGDAGNQYNKNLLIDYLINRSETNHLPSEFIVGMYINENEDGSTPSCFVFNPLFINNKENSQTNIKNLKNKLLQLIESNSTSMVAREFLQYCLGQISLSDEEIQNNISLIDRFFTDSTYTVLKQVVEEKQMNEKAKNISLDDLIFKY